MTPAAHTSARTPGLVSSPNHVNVNKVQSFAGARLSQAINLSHVNHPIFRGDVPQRDVSEVRRGTNSKRVVVVLDYDYRLSHIAHSHILHDHVFDIAATVPHALDLHPIDRAASIDSDVLEFIPLRALIAVNVRGQTIPAILHFQTSTTIDKQGSHHPHVASIARVDQWPLLMICIIWTRKESAFDRYGDV